jgi:hypothetical protein
MDAATMIRLEMAPLTKAYRGGNPRHRFARRPDSVELFAMLVVVHGAMKS